jgi:hypothetical protein
VIATIWATVDQWICNHECKPGTPCPLSSKATHHIVTAFNDRMRPYGDAFQLL